MRHALRNPVRTAAVLMLFVLGGYAWSGTSSSSSVPAGKQHLTDVKRAAPDAAAEDPQAANLTTVKEQGAYYDHGRCFAGSAIKDDEALGGFGPSDNLPRKVMAQQAGRGLYLLAQPTVAPLQGKKPAMRVVLVNQTGELLAFPAQDSALRILQEAKNADGKWVPIERIPRTRCGNSFHRVFLPTEHYWEFSVPRYRGPFATTLRFTMTLANGSAFSSNEFDGSIDPSQFQLPKP